jgi:hypothetical protein
MNDTSSSSDSDDEEEQNNTLLMETPATAINEVSADLEPAKIQDPAGVDTGDLTTITTEPIESTSGDNDGGVGENTNESTPVVASDTNGVATEHSAPEAPNTAASDTTNDDATVPTTNETSASGGGGGKGVRDSSIQEAEGESESKEGGELEDSPEPEATPQQGGGKQLPPPAVADSGTADSTAGSEAAASADATVGEEESNGGSDGAFKMDPQQWGLKDDKEMDHTEVWSGDKINFYWGPSIGWVVGTVGRPASSAELRVELEGGDVQVKTSGWLVDFVDGDQMMCELDMSTRGQEQGAHHWYFVSKAPVKTEPPAPKVAPPPATQTPARGRPSIADPTPGSSSIVSPPPTSDKFGGMGDGPELKYFNKGKAKQGDRVSIHTQTGDKVGTGVLTKRSADPSVVEVLVDAPGFFSQGSEFGPDKALKSINLHPSFLLPIRDKKSGGSKKRKAGGGGKGKDKRAKGESRPPPDKFGGLGAGPVLQYFDKKKVIKGQHVSIHKQDSQKVATGVIDCRVLINPALVEVVVDPPGFMSEGRKFGPGPGDTPRIHLHPSFLLLLKK